MSRNNLQSKSVAHGLMAMPGIIAISMFVIVPVVIIAVLSLQSRHGYASSGDFVGLTNLMSVFTSKEFIQSLLYSISYSACTVFLQLVLGLLTALALRTWNRAVPAFLAVILMQYVLPTVLVTTMWRWLLHDSLGLFNVWLHSLNMTSGSIIWFSESNIFVTLVLVSTWQFFPFVVLLCYARLVTIPSRRYEVAAVDGITPVGRFIKVTLPELRSVILTVIILRGLWMFTKFDTVWLLTGKEAIGKYAETLPILAYRKTFEIGLVSEGAAIAAALLILLVFATSIYRITVGYNENVSES